VSEPASISASIAARYATAIFELSTEADALSALEADVDALDAALKDSADFRDVISSPVYSREQQVAAMAALGPKLGLSETTTNALRLMGEKRRLFVLPQMTTLLRGMIADAKGEMTADITAAAALTKAQTESLSKVLADAVGKTIKLNMTVDETLIGGLVVKVGSKMIDTSIRSKLAQLQNAMKEVG